MIRTKVIASLSSLLILSALFLAPSFIHAQSLNLIVCNGPDCSYGDLITLIKNVINDLVILSTFVVIAALVFLGVKLLTSGEKANALKEVKDLFGKVIVGYFFIIAGWLIVYTITSVLFRPGYSILGSPNIK